MPLKHKYDLDIMNESPSFQAAELLQSVMRGHMSRKHVLETNKRRPSHQGASVYDEDTNSVSESDLDSAAELVQSSFRGHRARREQLKKRWESLL